MRLCSISDFWICCGRRGTPNHPRTLTGEFTRSLTAPGNASASENFVALAELFTAAYLELRFGGKLEAAPRLSLLVEELERQNEQTCGCHESGRGGKPVFGP